MPAYYDQPAVFANTSVEDTDKWQKLPFYLVKNEVKQFARWNIFDQLYGSIDWEPNMGNTMKGVTPQNSPVGRAMFFPNEITAVPNKDVFEVQEATEDATLKWHRYESKQFNFLPNFNSFWKDHLKFANDDIARQIQIANNLFIQTRMYYLAPYVFYAGTGMELGPNAMGNAADTAANSKNKDWRQAITGKVTANATLRNIYAALMALEEDIGAPAFEGASNMPKDNVGLQDKYVIVGDNEMWGNFPFDPDTHLLKSIDLNLLFNDFRGSLFGKATFKFNQYPIRFGDDGTIYTPEIEDQNTKRTYRNPQWTDINTAKYSVGWVLAGGAYRTIKTGPPPKEFATKRMDAGKFYSMRWNAEIQLTDQVLIKYADGSYDLNKYGTQLQMIAQTTHGMLTADARYAIPFIYRRKRPPLIGG